MAQHGEPILLDRLSWPEVRELVERGTRLCLLPGGATEQHGPHLPLNTDTLAAAFFCHEVSRRTGVPVLPPVAYGCSLGHTRRWPGTLSLLPQTLARVAEEVMEWAVAAGFTRIAIFNHHATNFAPFRVALEMIRYNHADVRVWIENIFEVSPRVRAEYTADAADSHAAAAETSLLLAIAPELVRMERAMDEPDRTEGRLFSYNVAQASASGVVGRPTTASREQGLKLIEMVIEDLTAKTLAALREEPPSVRPGEDRQEGDL